MADVRDYRVRFAAVGERYKTWTDLSGNRFPTENTVTLDGLVEGGSYKVQVRSRFHNAIGGKRSGPWSTEHTFTVPAAVSLPEPPTGVEMSVLLFDSVTISWADPGDDTVTAHRVLRRTDDTAEFAAVGDDIAAPAMSFTDTTVSADTAYEYQVTAVSAVGESLPSGTLTARTLAAPVLTVVPPPDTQQQEQEQDQDQEWVPTFSVRTVPPLDAQQQEQEQELIAMFAQVAQQQAETESLFSTTMTVGSTTHNSKTHVGYSQSSPDIGSLGSRSISTSAWNCNSGGSCARNIDGIYFINHGSGRYDLVALGARYWRSDWTLTVGSVDHLVDNSAYHINTGNTFHGQPTIANSRVWYNVGDPGHSASDTVDIEITRPVPPPTYIRPPSTPDPDPLLVDTPWTANMTVAERSGSVFGFVQGSIGSLDRKFFAYGGQNAQVTEILLIDFGGDLEIQIKVTPRSLAEELQDAGAIFVVGDQLLHTSDAIIGSTTDAFGWDVDALSWSVGDNVDLELRVPILTPYGNDVTGRVEADGGWSAEYHLTNSTTNRGDAVVVSLQGGHSYRVEISTEPGAGARLRWVLDPNGVMYFGEPDWRRSPIPGNANARGSSGTSQYVDVSAAISGDYYIEVWGWGVYSPQLSPYQVRVTRQ